MKKNLLFLAAGLLSAVVAPAQWLRQAVPFSQPTFFPASLQAVDAATVWAIGSNPSGLFTVGTTGTREVARTTDGGATWRVAPVAGLLPNDALTSLSARDAATAWATTTGETRSQLLRTTDGGATWQALLTLTDPTAERSLNYVHFFDAQRGICLGDSDNSSRLVVLTTADGGTTWTRNLTIPVLTTFFGGNNEYLVSGSRPAVQGDHIWVATTASRVFHSPDRGLSWTVSRILPDPNPTPNGPRALAFADATNGLALFSRTDGFTNQAPLYRTADGGATWQPVSFTGPLHGANLVRMPGTEAYLSVGHNLPAPGLAPDAGSSVSRDGGLTWTALESSFDHLLLDAAGPLAVWSSAYDFATGRSTGVLKISATALPTRAAAARAAGPQVFPQPSADGRFQVQLPAPQAGLRLRVRNGLGQLVWSQTLPGRVSRFAVELPGQPAGLYVLELRPPAGPATQTRLLIR